MQILPLIPISSPASPKGWKFSNFDANCCKWARPGRRGPLPDAPSPCPYILNRSYIYPKTPILSTHTRPPAGAADFQCLRQLPPPPCVKRDEILALILRLLLSKLAMMATIAMVAMAAMMATMAEIAGRRWQVGVGRSEVAGPRSQVGGRTSEIRRRRWQVGGGGAP